MSMLPFGVYLRLRATSGIGVVKSVPDTGSVGTAFTWGSAGRGAGCQIGSRPSIRAKAWPELALTMEYFAGPSCPGCASPARIHAPSGDQPWAAGAASGLDS